MATKNTIPDMIRILTKSSDFIPLEIGNKIPVSKIMYKSHTLFIVLNPASTRDKLFYL